MFKQYHSHNPSQPKVSIKLDPDILLVVKKTMSLVSIISLSAAEFLSILRIDLGLKHFSTGQ